MKVNIYFLIWRYIEPRDSENCIFVQLNPADFEQVEY